MAHEARSRSDLPVRRYNYGNESIIVADLQAVGDPSIEVLEDTVIVVLEGEGEETQYEIDLPPEGVSNTFIINGVLTIELNDQ